MSIRAYKLIEIKTAENHTFNLSTAEGNEFAEIYAENAEGYMMDFNRERMEEVAKEGDEKEKEIAKAILSDFEDGDDNITYCCY